ncbi:hypothetical protein AB0L57_16890 [Nocardia sp. NPDC052254]|uniref:hypothetical protein n=1 Tax=Nocardia sp. NPDC052254 TaxID=3155681 RepID=UPI003437C06E
MTLELPVPADDHVGLLLDHLDAVLLSDRLLDAGSGRGGTSFTAHRRLGCRVDGVSICLRHRLLQ